MDPYQFIVYLQIFGRVTLIWPPDLNINRREFVINQCIWLIVIVNNIFAISLLSVTLVKTVNDPVTISNLLFTIFVAGDCCLQMILVRIQWPRLQILIHDITVFLKNAKLTEKNVCNRYINRYLGYQCVFGTTVIMAVMAVLSVPLIQGKRFPVDSWYPFSTDPLGNRIFIYVVQYMMLLEIISYLAYDNLVIMLLWYLTARFKLLSAELHKVRTAFQLRNCVKRHNELIRLVRETEYAIKWTILKTLGAAIVVFVSAGLLVSHHRDFALLSECFLTVFGTIARLILSAWAADDLTETAASLSWVIYHSPVFGRPPDLSKGILIIIQMSHRSLAIKLWGLDMKFSLKFVTQYLLKVLSYYMTMRVVIARYV